MTDTHTNFDTPRQTLSWPRIAGTAFAIALHIVVFMTLMAPVTPPQSADKDEEVTLVNFIEPPPPPPPPPPPKAIVRIVEVPKPREVVVEEPPVVYETSSPVAYQAPPPPPPPPPPAPAPDFQGTVDPTGRALNPPKYPPEENRRGIKGTTILILTYDVNGTVTDVVVEKSSGNRNLDRAAVTAARRWKINPGTRDGVRVAGKAKVPVEFTL